MAFVKIIIQHVTDIDSNTFFQLLPIKHLHEKDDTIPVLHPQFLPILQLMTKQTKKEKRLKKRLMQNLMHLLKNSSMKKKEWLTNWTMRRDVIQLFQSTIETTPWNGIIFTNKGKHNMYMIIVPVPNSMIMKHQVYLSKF